MIRCEKCGLPINYIMADVFNREGNDAFHKFPLAEHGQAVSFITNSNWCGYELTEEEQIECIKCPHCNKYPFNSTEVQLYDQVEVVMFKDKAPYITDTEKNGLFIPAETTERLITGIENNTLLDDHETITAMSLRVLSIIKGTYKWYGDDDFTRLTDTVLHFWRSRMKFEDMSKLDPEYIFCMGRLLTIVHQLSQYLDNMKQCEPKNEDD